MSLPSIQGIAKDFGVDLETCTAADRERILVEAMRRDMPLAVSLLHAKAHEADGKGGCADWIEDPNSAIGKQLIRLHASDALRPLAQKYFCHGKRLMFVNCCKGKVGEPPKDEEEDLLDLQIRTQVGPIAYADC